jgi:small subunit ribosomal protein S17
MAKNMRKVRTASVVRTKMDQTAVVEMVWKQRHPIYHKQVRRVARFYVHDPQSQCQVGDLVRIEETRPISKTKHWRLLEILERRQVAEVRPIELESDVEPVITGEALLQTPPSEEDTLDVADGDTEEDSAGDEDTQA